MRVARAATRSRWDPPQLVGQICADYHSHLNMECTCFPPLTRSEKQDPSRLTGAVTA
jgi:hypothetical protein